MSDSATVHYTPEEHDQPACNADVYADPGETMYGTLNPAKVTCMACRALIAAGETP